MIRDVAIAGAGPVGATLALALAHADLDIVVLDARAEGESAHERTLAISHGARLIFERVGVWTPLVATQGAVTPIVAIDVSQARGFGAVRLEASEQSLPALGYVVSYRALANALDDALKRAGIDVRFGTAVRSVIGSRDCATLDLGAAHDAIDARLAVVADGAGAAVEGIGRRRHDYRQVAIVASVSIDRPHHGVAYERFTPDGPIALLPQRDHYALVWTRKPADADAALALDERAFVAALRAHFGSRMRGFSGARERRAFPLALEVARQVVAPRTAVIGNAAQALHPIAALGFNLGLRDAFELARAIVDAPRDAIGAKAMLARYARLRASDRKMAIAFTDGLVRLFANDVSWLHIPRGVGMMVLDVAPFAKRAFAHAMLFGVH
ncbi:MAG TPA: FAD-dependent monooxygenase [Casimicrobiaceae bacterium]|nr:FAD-dependent monooxygenase [Casimicrobiaceae bacterium]